jgi:hydroxylysine kinase
VILSSVYTGRWTVRSLQRSYADRRTWDKPALTCSAACKLAKAFFPFVSLKETAIKELNSYDDRNFYIEGVIEEQTKRESGAFMLKITNRQESASIALLEAQNDFMLHLLEGGFAAPRPVQARNGSYIVAYSIPHPDSPGHDPVYAIRLFTFLQGDLLAEVKQDPCLLVEVGKTIGKISIHLKVVTDTSDMNIGISS